MRHRVALCGFLSLREFLRLASRDKVPDHSWLSKTRSRLPHEVHEKVFEFVKLVAERGLVKGERIGVDGSTMEANAAMRTIVRRDSGETYREMLTRMAKRAALRRRRSTTSSGLTAARQGKKLSNEDWRSKPIPTQKNRRDEGWLDASRLQTRVCGRPRYRRHRGGADPRRRQGDTTTLVPTLETAARNLADIDIAGAEGCWRGNVVPRCSWISVELFERIAALCAHQHAELPMYFRRKTSAGRAYLQIVESHRDGDQVRQQVIATLGRFEELQASGQLERLLRSGARFAAKAMVLSAASDEAATTIAVRRIGPALVFERLWQETGCRAAITELAGKRRHGFALGTRGVPYGAAPAVRERLRPRGGSLARGLRHRRRRELDLHHLYRAMAWLGEELPEKEQDGRTPFAPRCVKDVVEERLFAHRRDLLTPARPRVHGHHQPLLRGRRRPDARPARLQQGPSSGPAADDPRSADRRRRAAGLLGDVAGQHRRRDDADPGDRSAAPALRHRAACAWSPTAA